MNHEPCLLIVTRWEGDMGFHTWKLNTATAMLRHACACQPASSLLHATKGEGMLFFSQEYNDPDEGGPAAKLQQEQKVTLS